MRLRPASLSVKFQLIPVGQYWIPGGIQATLLAGQEGDGRCRALLSGWGPLYY